MTITIHRFAQRSDDWRRARVGRLTGSRAVDMMATIKTGEAAARRDLRIALVVERLTGIPQDADGYVSKDMQRGIDCEPLALAAYEAATGLLVRRTGFLAADDLPVGCSLDGDVDRLSGIVEVKCPKSATHCRYLRAGGVPSEYGWQIVHNLWISGAAWCDFVSFDDRFPVSLQLFRVRVPRSDEVIAAYGDRVRTFLAEVDRDTEAVAALGAARVAA